MNKKKALIVLVMAILMILIIIISLVFSNGKKNDPTQILNTYFSYLQNEEYEKMYELIDDSIKTEYTQEVFISRNKNIYNGMEAKNIKVDNIEVVEEKDKIAKLTYNMSMDTIAGNLSFKGEITLKENADKKYKIKWSSKMIYPGLDDTEKIKVSTTTPKRGSIYDRNNVLLAGEGTVSSVGLVPGKMNKDAEADIKKIAELLGTSSDRIQSSLKASYVKSDTFVPIANVSKENSSLKGELLQIPGIKITDAKSRVYPYGEQMAHLIGYVQNISAEELEANQGKGYTETSVIGKTGLEKIYEDRLRGKDGIEIYITDSQGNKNETIAKIDVQNGEKIKLTIDAGIQKYVYEEFKNDKSATVVINPKTGEVIALCSTPSYDTNEFLLGMTNSKWKSLQDNENRPLYNRYQAKYVPGSSFKPIIGAIGISTGKIKADEDFGTSGLKWQKDTTWGPYNVTTLKEYPGPANLENALIYSDNIYFAKLALKIGGSTLANEFSKIGFNKQIDFVQSMTASTFGTNSTFGSEIEIADTGYGQGKVLTNPVHMASMYTAFVNNGNMLIPYIEYKENAKSEIYVENAFSKEAAKTIKEDLIQVIENPNGTANSAKIEGIKLAGKTGTAEIKDKQDDETGTNLGWFCTFTADENSSKQFLIVSMVEDVKDRGGSKYLLPKVKRILQKSLNS